MQLGGGLAGHRTSVHDAPESREAKTDMLLRPDAKGVEKRSVSESGIRTSDASHDAPPYAFPWLNGAVVGALQVAPSSSLHAHSLPFP